MSVSMDMIVEMLPLSSKLQQSDNPLRIVLDRTVGEWLDNFSQPYEQLFLTSATGGWLDAHGRDYGVPRRIDEDDDSYRQRIVYEKLDHLTPLLLSDVYNVRLFSYREDFDVKDNTLVSDNPHIVMNDSFLGTVDEDTIRILDKKFILDSVVTWINSDGELEYIWDARGVNILPNYSKIYYSEKLVAQFRGNESIVSVRLGLNNAIDCRMMFEDCSNLNSVDLTLPNATNCNYMFEDCSDLENTILDLPKVEYCGAMFKGCSMLVSIDLNLPNVTRCDEMFNGCSMLNEVKLNLPKLNTYSNMFRNASIIKTIDVNIPVSKVSGFKSYVTGLNLQHLTSFKINGEEQL